MSLLKVEAIESLDRQFREVPLFLEVKHFSNFLTITQQGGNEQKDFVKQLIPVVAPLLGSHLVLQYTQVVVDFVLITQYTTYNNKTLKYINQAIF